MVMAITTRSKAPKEVAFQEKEPFKGKEPQDWQKKKKVQAIDGKNCLGITKG